MSDPDIDFTADPFEHLAGVLAGAGDDGRWIEHSEGVLVVKRAGAGDRNLWGIVVDGDCVVTVDVDLVPSTDALGRYINQVAAVTRSTDADAEDEADELPQPGSWQRGMH
jgi:hypothetical protein